MGGNGKDPNTQEPMMGEPMLALWWDEYDAGRVRQFVHFRRPEQDNKERLVSVTWPSHIATWPRAGGMQDQEYVIVRVFTAFLKGEQRGVVRQMNK